MGCLTIEVLEKWMEATETGCSRIIIASESNSRKVQLGWLTRPIPVVAVGRNGCSQPMSTTSLKRNYIRAHLSLLGQVQKT